MPASAATFCASASAIPRRRPTTTIYSSRGAAVGRRRALREADARAIERRDHTVRAIRHLCACARLAALRRIAVVGEAAVRLGVASGDVARRARDPLGAIDA